MNSLVEEQYGYYSTSSLVYKGVHAFPKGISLKLNVLARLDFEPAYNDVAIYHVNPDITRILIDSLSFEGYIMPKPPL